MIFDDISDNLLELVKHFALTVGGANTSGIEPANGILFINGVFKLQLLIIILEIITKLKVMEPQESPL